MTTLLDPSSKTIRRVEEAEARILLRNVTWETYEHLLVDLSANSVPHLTYDRGDLEIMSPTAIHERINRAIEVLVSVVAFEMKINYTSLGSTTFQRKDIKIGFEPDSSYYFARTVPIQGKKRVDLALDPPPDLVVEIDIASSSIEKLPMFASIGVSEIWCYRDGNMEIFLLKQGTYVLSPISACLPFLGAEILTTLISQSLTLGSIEWMETVRTWAQQVKASTP